MKPDDTLVEAWPKLADSLDCVSTVLDRLEQCAKKHGNASVRLGTDGKGAYPSFRISFMATSGESEQVYNSYFDSGKPFPSPYNKVTPGRWSSRSMTLEAVKAFYLQKGGLEAQASIANHCRSSNKQNLSDGEWTDAIDGAIEDV